MGFIRESLLVIASVLFFISILATNSFLILTSSLEYDVVYSEIKSTTNKLNLTFNNYSQDIKTYCQNNSYFIFKEPTTGNDINLSCEIILKNQESINNYDIEEFINQTYYKEYNCSFIECIKKEPLFVLSKEIKDYWKNKFYFALLISIILLIAIFLLTKTKSNFFVLSGTLITISAIPFMKINSLISAITIKENLLMQQTVEMLSVLFTQSSSISLRIMIIGIIMIIIGLIMKMFKAGFKINGMISKIKEIKKKKTEKKKSKK